MFTRLSKVDLDAARDRFAGANLIDQKRGDIVDMAFERFRSGGGRLRHIIERIKH